MEDSPYSKNQNTEKGDFSATLHIT